LIGDSRAAISAQKQRLSAEKPLGEPRVLAGWHPEPTLPAAQGAGVNAEEPGKRSLAEAPFPPVCEQALPNGLAGGPRGAYPRNRTIPGRNHNAGFVRLSSQFVTEHWSAPTCSATWRWSSLRSSRRLRR